jgi:alpha-glucosidase
MLEAYGSVEQIMGYYGTPDAPGGHFPFNFRLISDVDSSSSAEDFSRIINEYLEQITEGRIANWVVSDANCAVSDAKWAENDDTIVIGR